MFGCFWPIFFFAEHRNTACAIVTTLLALLGLVGLLALRFVGLYSHQALAVVLLLGGGWAVVSRVWLAWKGRLHPGLLRGFRGRDNRPRFFQAAGRASFWAVTRRRVPGGLPSVGGNDTPGRRPNRRFPASSRGFVSRLAPD